LVSTKVTLPRPPFAFRTRPPRSFSPPAEDTVHLPFRTPLSHLYTWGHLNGRRFNLSFSPPPFFFLDRFCRLHDTFPPSNFFFFFWSSPLGAFPLPPGFFFLFWLVFLVLCGSPPLTLTPFSLTPLFLRPSSLDPDPSLFSSPSSSFYPPPVTSLPLSCRVSPPTFLFLSLSPYPRTSSSSSSLCVLSSSATSLPSYPFSPSPLSFHP